MKVGQETERDVSSADIRRILLAEDDPGVRRATIVVLRDLGYRVDAFANGFALLTALARDDRSFELLLTDFEMPGMTGYELARRLRVLKPSVKILLTSGRPEEDLLGEPLPEDWPAFIAKPFSYDSLERKLHEILDEPKTSSQGPAFEGAMPARNVLRAAFRAVTTQ